MWKYILRVWHKKVFQAFLGVVTATVVIVGVLFGISMVMRDPVGTYVYTGTISEIDFTQVSNTVGSLQISLDPSSLTVDSCAAGTKCSLVSDPGGPFAMDFKNAADIKYGERVTITCVVGPIDFHNFIDTFFKRECWIVRAK